MGKKYKNNDIDSLLEQKKVIEKKIRQRTIPCSHTGKDGKIKGDVLPSGQVKCKRCGETFSVRRIHKETLEDAVRIVTDVINQCKIFSENPREEQEMVETLGRLGYSVSELPEMYRRTIIAHDNNGKKKNKKHNNYDEYDNGNGYGHIDILSKPKKKGKSKKNSW